MTAIKFLRNNFAKGQIKNSFPEKENGWSILRMKWNCSQLAGEIKVVFVEKRRRKNRLLYYFGKQSNQNKFNNDNWGTSCMTKDLTSIEITSLNVQIREKKAKNENEIKSLKRWFHWWDINTIAENEICPNRWWLLLCVPKKKWKEEKKER